jgi:hypothetical protein
MLGGVLAFLFFWLVILEWGESEHCVMSTDHGVSIDVIANLIVFSKL